MFLNHNMPSELEVSKELGMVKSSLLKNQMARFKIQTEWLSDLGKIASSPCFGFLLFKMWPTVIPSYQHVAVGLNEMPHKRGWAQCVHSM